MRSFWSRLRSVFHRREAKAKRSRPLHQPRPFGAGRFEQLESREMLTVSYHGGALLSRVEAQGVYLGSDWANNSSLHSQAAALDQYVNYLVNSPYMDMLTTAGYNVGRGSATTGKELNVSINKATGVTDSQIQADIQSAINSGQLATPDANRLYVVYVEPGVVIKLGSETSQNGFLGYHGAFAGRTAAGSAADIRYAVIAYPGSPNPSATSQGFATAMDDMTAVASHEIAEAVTDPDVNYKRLGWYDDQLNGEIGDLTSRTTRLNGYLVQDVVGKNDQVIAPVTTGTGGTLGGTGGSTGGSTGGTTTTLAAPTNVTATPLSPTSASLSWTASSGAAGYRIFLVENGQTTLLGSVGASTTAVTVTQLRAGMAEGFKVEAFSGSTVADSNVVSITMPNQPTLTAPQVTATVLSSTSVRLTWNPVAGAQGYSIYLWNGFRVIYLGTVGSSTTSVRVTGLAPGSTTQLLVEAFGGGRVADSDWLSITTPSTSTTGTRFARLT